MSNSKTVSVTKPPIYLYAGIVFILLGILVFYYLPHSTQYFIACPLQTFTGLQCPGCGSQRALHEILHLNFAAAFSYNPLFVLGLPAGLLFFFLNLKKPQENSQSLAKEYFQNGFGFQQLLACFYLVYFVICKNAFGWIFARRSP